jgi:hypothetical protein
VPSQVDEMSPAETWALARADQRRWNRVARLAAWLVRRLHIATYNAASAAFVGNELNIPDVAELVRGAPGYRELDEE